VYKRNSYITDITPFLQKPVIKIITGMRRVGKSTFLRQIMQTLQKKGVKKHQMLLIDKESLDFDTVKTYKDLNRLIKKTFQKQKGKAYLFIDEVQEIEQWEKTITSLFKEGKTDIYLTGSNAHLLSSELATFLSGRYIEFPLYSLSFQEFLQFRDTQKEDNETELLRYLKFGGLPGLHDFSFTQKVVYPYISAIYNTILLKDVVSRHEIRNITLLENTVRFVMDNLGSIFSAKKIADYLKSQRIQLGVETIQHYLSYLSDSFLIYRVPRYDIKGKRWLEISEKYFLGDIGIRHALLGYREGDINGLLENVTYLELRRRGYRVSIGKWKEKEIDFVAEKEGSKIYVQVCYLLASPSTVEREFGTLLQISDNHPKYVVSMDKAFGNNSDGITRLHLMDFLLQEEW
jgi:uncharacterized protein